LINSSRDEFHAELCENLLAFTTTAKHGSNASNADASNPASRTIANHIANKLGAAPGNKVPAQTIGNLFEDAVGNFVRSTFTKLSNVRPGDWRVERVSSRNPLVIAKFQQYGHLEAVYNATMENPELAGLLGRDYSVASDVVVYKDRLSDNFINETDDICDVSFIGNDDLRSVKHKLPSLHASISCKWTIRSDRAQNSRTEALDLIRKRKGRVPHIAVVTAEPLPSRLSSLCLGTGDLDCVYHFALPELVEAVASIGQSEAVEMLSVMIESMRLKDIRDLPLDLAV
jgi:hypothetical protein